MKALISRKYLDSYDMRQLTRAVHELFDDYNFIRSLIKERLIERPINSNPVKNHYNNYNEELKAITKRETYINYLKEFDKKMEYLKSTLTEDELKILEYCIENRESDKEVCDRVAKSYKSYFIIKKSCYVKIALKFNLLSDMGDIALERGFKVVA